MSALAKAASNGSSPLARGLLAPSLERWPGLGIIPARAGFTARHSISAHVLRDHPRSRGVYWPDCASACPMCGSSPLARGLPDRGRGRAQVDGIIPARAGFTSLRRPQSGRRRDHPRSRGVYPIPSPDPGPHFGSSPLARGLPVLWSPAIGACGIIPARAGFTDGGDVECDGVEDHPRSRGVY